MKLLNRDNYPAPEAHPIRMVQFGGGNFLRAFCDWMVQKMNEAGHFAGDVAMVKATPGGDYQQLRHQDGLYQVFMQGWQHGQEIDQVNMITCVSKIVHAYEDYDQFMDLACLDDLQFVVSNTTEAGIVWSPEDQFSDQPAASFPGKLCQFLYKRYQHFAGEERAGLIILPCELIEDNGSQLEQLVLKHAAAWNLENGFASWIQQANWFCNTLVDRIVTGYPREGADALQQRTGWQDKKLTVAEPYHLWVIEGPEVLKEKFPAAKAGLNVIFTDDLSMYRERKVAILNGAHSSMVPVGLLAGIDTVGTFVKDEDLRTWLQQLVTDEIIPALDYDPDMLKRYFEEVMDRFRNPFLTHQLSSIALNSVSKFRSRIMPTMMAYHRKKEVFPHGLALVLAALIRFYRGDWQGTLMPVQDDPNVVRHFQQMWQDFDRHGSYEQTVRQLLANPQLWGEDLSKYHELTSLVSQHLQLIDEQGVRACL